jgi:hypothetical protein
MITPNPPVAAALYTMSVWIQSTGTPTAVNVALWDNALSDYACRATATTTTAWQKITCTSTVWLTNFALPSAKPAPPQRP